MSESTQRSDFSHGHTENRQLGLRVEVLVPESV